MTNSGEEWNYKDDEIGDFKKDPKIGLNISGFAEFLDIPFLNLVAEIGYNQKGMKEKVLFAAAADGSGELKTVTNRVDYIDLSLAVKLNYALPLITPYVFAGPRIDVLVGSDVDPGHKIVYDDYEKLVYGLKIGLGSEIGNILPLSVLAEFQYNYDLSDAYKTEYSAFKDIALEVLGELEAEPGEQQ